MDARTVRTARWARQIGETVPLVHHGLRLIDDLSVRSYGGRFEDLVGGEGRRCLPSPTSESALVSCVVVHIKFRRQSGPATKLEKTLTILIGSGRPVWNQGRRGDPGEVAGLGGGASTVRERWTRNKKQWENTSRTEVRRLHLAVQVKFDKQNTHLPFGPLADFHHQCT